MTREQIAAWVARTRAERGLPRHVEDDQVLTDLARAITDPTPSTLRHRPGGPSPESDRDQQGVA